MIIQSKAKNWLLIKNISARIRDKIRKGFQIVQGIHAEPIFIKSRKMHLNGMSL